MSDAISNGKLPLSAAGLLRAGVEAGLLAPGGRMLVALSGGADSTALLLALREYGGFELIAAHLNHCLRGDESDRDEEFCRALCIRLGIEFISERADVLSARKRGEGIEEAARRIRYGFLLRAAESSGAERIALAHNADDLAETMLMNLARGAGSDGLRGIPIVRRLAPGVTAVRPLLRTSRAEIERYLAERGESYVTDSTNLSDDYTRNIVRHRIIPELRALNPRFVEHAALAADSLGEDSALLDSLARPLAENARAPDIASAPRPLAVRALRMLCAEHSFSPSRAQTEALLSLCRSSSPSARISLGAGLEARRSYERIIISPRGEPQDVPRPVPLYEGENEYAGGVISVVRAAAPAKPGRELWLGGDLDPPFGARPRAEGDSIRLRSRGRKTLKKLFIDEKIPAAGRAFVPVITADGKIAGVLGFGADEAFIPPPGEPAWHLFIKTQSDKNQSDKNQPDNLSDGGTSRI